VGAEWKLLLNSYLVSLILFSPYILIKKGEQLHDLEKILCGRIRSHTGGISSERTFYNER
jgi:hypothetical protein